MYYHIAFLVKSDVSSSVLTTVKKTVLIALRTCVIAHMHTNQLPNLLFPFSFILTGIKRSRLSFRIVCPFLGYFQKALIAMQRR